MPCSILNDCTLHTMALALTGTWHLHLPECTSTPSPCTALLQHSRRIRHDHQPGFVTVLSVSHLTFYFRQIWSGQVVSCNEYDYPTRDPQCSL